MAAAGLGQEAGLLSAAVPPSPSGVMVEAPPPVDGRAVADVKVEGGEKTLPIADDPQPRAMTVVVAAVLALALALALGAKDGDDGNGEKRPMPSAAADGERGGLAGGYRCSSNAVAAAAGALAPFAAKATPPMLVALLTLLLALGPRFRASCGWLLGPTGSEGEKGSVCGLVPAAPKSPCTEGRKA